MKLLLTKVYRKFFEFLSWIASCLRIIHYRIKYPGLYIDFSSYVGPNVIVKCIDGGKLRILNSTISNGTLIQVDKDGEAEINSAFIGHNCIIVCKDRITIGRNCQIAEMVVIRDQDHRFGEEGLSIAEQGFNTAPILIGENVWLASKVTVLKGVVIGDNAVVGASSVVRCNMEPNSVYVGIPARKVK